LNPIFAKDLRSGLLGKFEYLLRFSYVATIGTELLLIFVAITADASGPNDEANWFQAWALFHFFMLLIAAAWLGARSIAPEHEQQTLAQLISAPLTPAEIVRGKIMAELAYTCYVWVMGLPMVLLLWLVGSIKFPAALSFISIELVFSLLVAAWGMYCSIHLVTVRRALGYTLGGLFCLIAGHIFASGTASEAISSFFREGARERVNLLIQAGATMISPLALMAHALTPPAMNAYGMRALQQLPVVPGALLLGSIGTLFFWWLTMRAFDRYAQNL
jgi:ABC-type transport system involved in multi-copper enzyme maturation permease subunit